MQDSLSGGEAATGFYRFPVLGGAEAERCQARPRLSTLFSNLQPVKLIRYYCWGVLLALFRASFAILPATKFFTGRNSLQINKRMFAIVFSTVTILSSVPVRSQSQSTVPDSPSASRFRQSYQPITGKQRLNWLMTSTLGPKTLVVGLFGSAISTAENSPREYGPGWEGFGKRYGIRLAGNATNNTMEAGLGSIWGEDPRYFWTQGETVNRRIRNVIAMAFLAHNREGKVVPAYARYIAVPGSAFLSNTWRADSEAHNGDALERVGFRFLGDMGSNAFKEFWPDFRRRVLHNKF
jgi:hypothetical protein